MMPSPPRRTGSANRSLNSSLKASRPVREGRNFCRMVSSRGLRRSAMCGMVLDKYVHLLDMPCYDPLFLLEYLKQLPYESDSDGDEFEGYLGPGDGTVIFSALSIALATMTKSLNLLPISPVRWTA